ncbi:MAG: hypothetical protein MJZ09_05800 [Bacteroidales bacterium]|nr:hypothetical protein [Bacteroidales bacterium]
MSATPSYIAPVAKVINAKLEGLICQSFGRSGEAGQDGSYSEIEGEL